VGSFDLVHGHDLLERAIVAASLTEVFDEPS
jgi:hypothetical protein